MKYTPELTTLCYIEQDGQYLMLHRVKKEHDINKDKYIGVGGHFERGESPDECLLREVYEETGLTLLAWRPRGIITFLYGDKEAADGRKAEAGDKRDEADSRKDQADDKKTPGTDSVPGDGIVEYMFLYTADAFSGRLKDCDEGELVWIDKSRVAQLPVWEGDKIFFDLLEKRNDYFSLKLVYSGTDELIRACLDGEELPIHSS